MKKSILLLVTFILIVVSVDIIYWRMQHKLSSEIRNNQVKRKNVIEEVVDGNKIQLVYLDKNGQKYIIDEVGNSEVDSGTGTYFSDIRFSPQKNYIIYLVHGFDGSEWKLYNIKSKKFVKEAKENGNVDMRFSNDEEYLVFCGNGYMGSYVVVYKLPEFEKTYDLFGKFCDDGPGACKGKYGTEFYNGYKVASCDWHAFKKDNLLKVTIRKLDAMNKLRDEKNITYKLP